MLLSATLLFLASDMYLQKGFTPYRHCTFSELLQWTAKMISDKQKINTLINKYTVV